MARIRSIHPGLFTDDAFMALSAPARVLWIGLWCEADDQGMFQWKPLTLKARILPADNVDVAALLDELISAGCVRRGEIGGAEYGAVRNFTRFQRPKSPNAVHPINDNFRKFVGLSPSIGEVLPQSSGNDGEGLPDNSGTDGEKVPQMEEGGVDGGGNPPPIVPPLTEAEFDAWWAAYPRKVAKDAARKAYAKARKRADAGTLLSAAQRYAKAQDDPKFTKHPATWLNGGCWDDEDAPAKPPPSKPSPDEVIRAKVSARKRGQYYPLTPAEQARAKELGLEAA